MMMMPGEGTRKRIVEDEEENIGRKQIKENLLGHARENVFNPKVTENLLKCFNQGRALTPIHVNITLVLAWRMDEN